MLARAGNLTLLFLFFSTVTAIDKAEKKAESGILTLIVDKLELKIGEYANYVTESLAQFNDERLGKSELGKFLHYEEMKPKIEAAGRQARGMKKMSMAMIPLIFHVGATSTWLLLTMFLAAKSVAIGMLLLIFKIAVSSAKVASFFTLLKTKHLLSHHHEYTPHYEHHGHKRSLEFLEHPTYLEHSPSHAPSHDGWNSYTPPAEWSAKEPHYEPTATYKEAADPYTEYAAESKKVEKNYG